MFNNPVPFVFEHKDIDIIEGYYFFDTSPYEIRTDLVENLVIRLTTEDLIIPIKKHFFKSELEIKKFIEVQLKMRFIKDFQPDEFEREILISVQSYTKS